ncbi:MAG: hypothetical protein IPN49_04420 [Saprospiraceae bacterium]|nr:hypothetical protein [Saprospiraceae bacterium]MBK8818356.1 hypothetical protein [Saprospiraceae bacterium]
MLELRNIERVSGLTKETFKVKYLSTHTPVIITDLIDNWPAKNKWSLDYFKKSMVTSWYLFFLQRRLNLEKII